MLVQSVPRTPSFFKGWVTSQNSIYSKMGTAHTWLMNRGDEIREGIKINNKRIHTGWIVLAITVLNVFASLGLARFSFAVILPVMKEGLSLSFTQTGLVASAMFFGYLISALFIGKFIHRYKEKKVIIASLLLIMTGMMISAGASQFFQAYLSCLIIGVGSGAGNITSMGLAGKWFSSAQRGKALGVTNSGSGLGMVFSGFLIPLVVLLNTEGWRIGWGLLAFCVLVIMMINIFFLIEDPKKLNLQPIGSNSKKAQSYENKELNIQDVYRNKYILLIGAVYFTWGFSYLIFSTFFVDFLVAEANIEMNTAGRFFAIAGITSIVSGFIWGSISDRIGRMFTLFLIYFMQTILLFSFSYTTSPLILLIETIAYALTLWAVPTVIVAAVSDITAPVKAPLAIGYITLFFGIGQWISPMVTGSIVENNGYTTAFFLSAAICFIGSIGCLILHFSLHKERRTALSEYFHELHNNKKGI